MVLQSNGASGCGRARCGHEGAVGTQERAARVWGGWGEAEGELLIDSPNSAPPVPTLYTVDPRGGGLVMGKMRWEIQM